MIQSLLDQILTLPKEQRAELAMLVLHSLQAENDAPTTSWHTPWTDELDRRRRELAEAARRDGERAPTALRARAAAR